MYEVQEENLNLLTQADKSSYSLLSLSNFVSHAEAAVAAQSHSRWDDECTLTSFNLLNLDKIYDEKVGVDWVCKFEHIHTQGILSRCHWIELSEKEAYERVELS